MGRHHSIELLPLKQQSAVNNIIRAHRYLGLSDILAGIEAQGIEGMSRSALGRYVPKLKAQDCIKSAPEEDTIVTIVERVTGKVLVVKTGVAADLIAANIANMRPIAAIS